MNFPINFVKHLKSDKYLSRLIVANQFEFKYFLNGFSSKNWLGSIAGKYYSLKESLNLLRRNSFKLDKYNLGGYHFTSIGGKELLSLQIENWGHQEFNIPIIKKNINKNINLGRDVFYRFGIKKNSLIDLKINKLFDQRITRILEKYNNLIIKSFKKESLIDIFEYRIVQIFIYSRRIIKEPLKAILKVKKLLNSTIIYLQKKIKFHEMKKYFKINKYLSTDSKILVNIFSLFSIYFISFFISLISLPFLIKILD